MFFRWVVTDCVAAWFGRGSLGAEARVLAISSRWHYFDVLAVSEFNNNALPLTESTDTIDRLIAFLIVTTDVLESFVYVFPELLLTIS